MSNDSLTDAEILPTRNAFTTKSTPLITPSLDDSSDTTSSTNDIDDDAVSQPPSASDKLPAGTENSKPTSLSPATTKLWLNVSVTPSNLVANCTDVEFRCEVLGLDSEVDSSSSEGSRAPPSTAWWTFRGANVSAVTLPGGRVTNPNATLSILNVDCSQYTLHDGDYMCHTALADLETSNQLAPVLTSANISLDIYVPLTVDAIEPANGTVRELEDTEAQLKCRIYAHPKPKITWERIDLNTLTVSNIEEDGRILIETQSSHQESQKSTFPNQVTVLESVLKFKPLITGDNGSYICKADSAIPFEKPLLTNFHVWVLEIPQVKIIKINENKTEAILTFTVDYGNLPVEKYFLEIRNFTIANSSWIAHNVQANSVTIEGANSVARVDGLTPGALYGFRLAAKNEVGTSEWSYMNITVPPDVPSVITQLHLLSKSDTSLLFGWRRPQYDNGGIIHQYQMSLRDLSADTSANQTLDINQNLVQSRNNYMYMFPNLSPGSHYSFQVRACSNIGCSAQWSSVLDAVTSDGHSDPPLNIHFECNFDFRRLQNNATIRWEPPKNARGSIVGYNITLEGFSQYRNVHNRPVLDQFRQFHVTSDADTHYHIEKLRPNANFTVRICVINKSGCGQLSHITSSSMCITAPTVPSEFPALKFEAHKATLSAEHGLVFNPSRQLSLFVPRVSEKNGRIACYRIIVCRLQPVPQSVERNNSLDTSERLRLYDQYLANGPDSVQLSTYRQVTDGRKDLPGAYIAKEFASDSLRSDIVIGDGKSERCFDDATEYDLRSRVKVGPFAAEDSRSPRRISYDLPSEIKNSDSFNDSALYPPYSRSLVEDGELVPNTTYTGFVEVTVLIPWSATNRTLLVARSPFVEPIQTEPLQSIQMITGSGFKSSFSETANGILYGTICGLLLILVLLFSVMCFLKRKAAETSQVTLGDERIGLTSLRRFIGGNRKPSLLHPLNFNSLGSIKKWAMMPIPIQSLQEVFIDRHKNNDFLFEAEFETLPGSASFPDRTTVHCDKNPDKNRYPDIPCYDQTRVCLSKIDDAPGSDYINANHVVVNEKQFISAQGPIQRTIGDFWRLIDEQSCQVIVMLTGIEEQGRIKCAQYWSDDQPTDVTAHLRVTLASRRDYSDYVIRRFTLQNLDTGIVRDVLHFHFIAWRDFLAPEQPSWLLRFIKRVNEHHCPDRGPILVHCSAGVGRTGTFIAIDSLIRQIDDGATHINIFACVSQLRYQRSFLVQSIKQYIFVYRAVMEYIEYGDTEVEAAHLADHYKQLKEQKFECGNGIILEFEKLNEVMEDPKSCIVGMMDQYMDKNRYDFIIPYDVNRVILSPTVASKDQSFYINASFIQGYDHALSFIVAQDPMEHTTNEFWWMIVEHSVKTLVVLSELGEGQSKCHCYWPADEFDCDQLKVKLIEEEMSQYYTKRVFSLISKKSTGEPHTVIQYQFLAWKSGVVPESTVALFTLVDAVLANNATSSSPLLVHCSGGGDRSSVFVAFASLVKQLRLEERLDIFQTARYTRSQRQCMLKTIAQYDFLYRCIIDYIDYSIDICNSGDTQL